jgi:hypothetical protein
MDRRYALPVGLELTPLRFDTRTMPLTARMGDKAKPPDYSWPAALLFGVRPAPLAARAFVICNLREMAH